MFICHCRRKSTTLTQQPIEAMQRQIDDLSQQMSETSQQTTQIMAVLQAMLQEQRRTRQLEISEVNASSNL